MSEIRQIKSKRIKRLRDLDLMQQVGLLQVVGIYLLSKLALDARSSTGDKRGRRAALQDSH